MTTFEDKYPYLVYTDKKNQNYSDEGGSSTIPVASSDTIGGVKIGSGINITQDGQISVDDTSERTIIEFETVDSTHIRLANISFKELFNGIENGEINSVNSDNAPAAIVKIDNGLTGEIYNCWTEITSDDYEYYNIYIRVYYYAATPNNQPSICYLSATGTKLNNLEGEEPQWYKGITYFPLNVYSPDILVYRIDVGVDNNQITDSSHSYADIVRLMRELQNGKYISLCLYVEGDDILKYLQFNNEDMGKSYTFSNIVMEEANTTLSFVHYSVVFFENGDIDYEREVIATIQ